MIIIDTTVAAGSHEPVNVIWAILIIALLCLLGYSLLRLRKNKITKSTVVDTFDKNGKESMESYILRQINDNSEADPLTIIDKCAEMIDVKIERWRIPYYATPGREEDIEEVMRLFIQEKSFSFKYQDSTWSMMVPENTTT